MGNIIGIHLQSGPMLAYSAEPTGSDRSGGILLLHDMWGLDDQTMGVADRLAAHGYHVLAPNLLAGTIMEKRIDPEIQQQLFDPSMRARSQAQMRLQTLVAPLKSPQMVSTTIMRSHACFEFLFNNPATRQHVGVLGFGYGGTHVFSLALREPRIGAAVAYYPQAKYVAYELAHINCPITAFYGDKDQQTMVSFFQLKSQMQAAGVDFTPVIYQGTGSNFFDSTLPSYSETAAVDSWSRMLAFFQKTMR